MKRKRHTEEQIIAILKEHEAGMKTADLCRKHGISEATDPRAERWHGLRMSEFERRQLTAIRNELDRAHAERAAPVVNANVTASPTRLSSKTRT
jgi:putative transposase